jgi:non-canonical purine NTP pyrophosphatase (RdgB/HAM1 family)
MTLYFITGNKGKFAEVRDRIPDVRQLDVDLPELQEFDARIIVRAKLEAARQSYPGSFIVEDTALYFHGLGGLPGPLIKWFLARLGEDGLYRLVRRLDDDKAEARTVLGYCDEKGGVHFFEGAVRGRIVAPRGAGGFGWDRLFQPDGYDQTFAEMAPREKNAVSMRRLALDAFEGYFGNQPLE